jgi:hypothetical protein
VESPTETAYLQGAIYGLAAVCIWGAFIVVSRLGVRTSLTPWGVAAIRFTVGKRQPLAAYRFGGLECMLLGPGEGGLMSMIG